MSDILAMDYTILSSSLTGEEISLLQQYQALAQNLNNVKEKLDEINNQMTTVDESNIQDLTSLATDLQSALGVLGTAFKSTVHNVLLHVDSNQVKIDDTNTTNDASNIRDVHEDVDVNDVVDEDEEEVDLDSGIDEETMNAVDRIQHELGISNDDVDIHRQIADQLEIENPDY